MFHILKSLFQVVLLTTLSSVVVYSPHSYSNSVFAIACRQFVSVPKISTPVTSFIALLTSRNIRIDISFFKPVKGFKRFCTTIFIFNLTLKGFFEVNDFLFEILLTAPKFLRYFKNNLKIENRFNRF